MSEPSPSAPEKADPPKTQVSPARNAIGLVVLLAVLVIGGIEVFAKYGYEAAVKAVDKRLQDEDHGLPEQSEAEKLIGKQPDDAGSEVADGASRFLKKTYTWKGLITSYTLAAYYRTGTPPALDHIEAGEKFQPQPVQKPAPPAAPPAEGKGGMGKGGMGKGGMGKGKGGMKKAPSPEGKAAPDAKADEESKPGADEKAAAPDAPKADDKKAPDTKPDDTPKPAADDKKAPDTKPDDTPKPAADQAAKPSQ